MSSFLFFFHCANINFSSGRFISREWVKLLDRQWPWLSFALQPLNAQERKRKTFKNPLLTTRAIHVTWRWRFLQVFPRTKDDLFSLIDPTIRWPADRTNGPLWNAWKDVSLSFFCMRGSWHLLWCTTSFLLVRLISSRDGAGMQMPLSVHSFFSQWGKTLCIEICIWLASFVRGSDLSFKCTYTLEFKYEKRFTHWIAV